MIGVTSAVRYDSPRCQSSLLAAALQLDYGMLSPPLERLEAAGLRPDDERAALISLIAARRAAQITRTE